MPDYICKSKLNEFKKENKLLRNVSVTELEKHFKKCQDTRVYLTGNKLNKNQCRHTYFVNADELLSRVLQAKTG